jgi:hypothetical protein
MESIKISGVAEDLELFEDRLVITPRGLLGFMNKGMKGSKEIPFHAITAIQFKEAGMLFSGYIQFTIPGGKESKGGILSAAQDENTFMFAKNVNDQMKKAKVFIYERIGRSESGGNKLSMADEVVKLKKLMDDGVISGVEFVDMKKKLVS